MGCMLQRGGCNTFQRGWGVIVNIFGVFSGVESFTSKQVGPEGVDRLHPSIAIFAMGHDFSFFCCS